MLSWRRPRLQCRRNTYSESFSVGCVRLEKELTWWTDSHEEREKCYNWFSADSHRTSGSFFSFSTFPPGLTCQVFFQGNFGKMEEFLSKKKRCTGCRFGWDVTIHDFCSGWVLRLISRSYNVLRCVSKSVQRCGVSSLPPVLCLLSVLI